MSGTARRLAEAANQIVNPQPVTEAINPSSKKDLDSMIDTVEKVYEQSGLKGRIPAMPKMGIHNSDYTVAEFIEEIPSFFANLTGEEKRYIKNEIRGMLKPQEKAKYAKILESVQIAEAFKDGDKVKVPHKGKMVSGRIIRYDDGGTSKAQQHGGGYVVDVGEPASIFVTKEKIQKEAAEQIDELSKKEADAEIKKAKEAEERARINYEADVDKIYDKMVKIFKQKNPRQWSLADELGGNPTVRQDAIEAADKGSAAREYRKAQETLKNVLAKYKQNMQKEEVVTEAEWKSLKKTKVDLNALRQQGYKISVQHGEGDTLYKITGKPSKPAMKKEAVDAKQAEIDAKIRKVNAADAVARIKEIINSYSHDKQTKGMIIAGMKSIKESAEITEAPYTPANDYEGEMAMTQLKSIMEKASDVLGMMKPEAKMEAWVQSKITLADEHISCVRDYLKHTDGAVG